MYRKLLREHLQWIVIFVLAVSGYHAWTSAVEAQSLPNQCADGGQYGSTLEQDTTWSGEVYLGRSLTVRDQATLTITAGTRVIMCGPHSLSIGALFNEGRLIAIGTPEEPIIFEPAPTVDHWERIFFEDALEQPSILRHVELRRGGGNDPTADDGSLVTGSHDPTVGFANPVIDHVTITESGSYGIRLNINEEDDPTPPALSNLTINNSARAPLRTDAAGVSGLGTGNSFSGNSPNRIQVGEDNLNGGMFFDQRWRQQPIPYEIMGRLYLRNNLEDEGKRFSTWRIDPGVTMLVHPGRNFNIGSLYGDARLLAEGTADAPILITRLNDDSDPWGQIIFDNFSVTDSHLRHVQLLYGGELAAEGNGTAVLNKNGSGTLTLNHVTIKFSQNTAVAGDKGDFNIENSVFELNGLGLFMNGATGVIRRSQFINNSGGGLLNDEADDICVDAAGNYWGTADGPSDSSDTVEACNSGRNNSGGGNTVSDGVIYWPWLSNAEGTPSNRSNIAPAQPWVAANGVERTELVVTVRDAQGLPLSGKQIRLETTRGVIQQPNQPTNAEGVTRAVISSTDTGEARISGHNMTDDEPLATQAQLYFWEGSGETGGLVQLSGPPYARPQLQVEGEPFQVGFPVIFRLPMENSTADSVPVRVQYAVSNFGIGQRFTPVSTASNTLAPGEAWDAPGGFTPPNTAHRCVRFTVDYGAGARQGGSFNGQTNLKDASPDPPCDEPDATQLIPRKGGLGGVRKHLKNLLEQTNLVNDCLKQSLTFRRQARQDNQRDYETIAQPPELTPQTVSVGANISQAEADAANMLAETVTQLTALKVALSETRLRLSGASEARAWNEAAMQLAAYQEYQRQRAQLLNSMADQIETLLTALDTAGRAELTFTPGDYQQYQADGFSAETVTFHRQTGLSQELVEAMQTAQRNTLAEGNFVSRSFTEIARTMQQAARVQAQELLSFYGTTSRQTDESSRTARIYPNEIDFVVGNPTDSEATVQLVVRPINLPVHWAYSLSQNSAELAAGQEISVTLTLNPGEVSVLKDVDIQVAVEGWIGDENIGGVLLQQRIPVSGTETTTPKIYLPLLVQP